MRMRVLALSGALAASLAMALSACSPAAEPQPSASAGCTARVVTSWVPEGADQLIPVIAEASGESCAHATIALKLETRDGAPLWSDTLETEHVMGLGGFEDNPSLQAAMETWLDPAQAQFKTTADLPAWPEGAGQPMLGEFYFYPEEGVDRAAYETWRGRAAPVFCYVQGMESVACVALFEGAMTKIGAQSFPG